MAGPLDGVRILDCTTVVLGPWAAQQLGDLGADVIKIEPPEGDTTRQLGPARNPGMSAFYLGCNRSKRSIVLDLKNPAQLEVARKIIAQSDVVLENFRPGVMERLGLGPDVCAVRNPKLVYGRITGWGQNGPMAQAMVDRYEESMAEYDVQGTPTLVINGTIHSNMNYADLKVILDAELAK